MRTRALLLGIFMLLGVASPVSAGTGGAEYGAESSTSQAPERPIVPGRKAVLLKNGLAAAPADAPPEVQQAVWAANEIQDKPYLYGGGHARFPRDRGYDCSGTISYALYGAGLLKTPLNSTGFFRYGAAGQGEWITIYTNAGHAYVVIAGLRLDTSAYGDRVNRGKGPRWRASGRPTRGYKLRHPVGF